MNRESVIQTIGRCSKQNGVYVFVGNGYNARALCALEDHESFFYMVGSMGLCSTLAAGFAHFTDQPVIAVEGDGNALMGMSGLPVVSQATDQKTFVHVVLVNGVYETTGGQKNLAPYVRFSQIALGSGYDRVLQPSDMDSFSTALESSIRTNQRTMIIVKTEKSNVIHERVKYDPVEVKDRFCTAVKEAVL